MSIGLGHNRLTRQLLPREDVAILVNNHKMMSNFDNEIRFDLSRRHAKQFMTSEFVPHKQWNDKQFEEVDWWMPHKSLKGKPGNYKVWLSKQHTGFCGTRLQAACYAGNESVGNSCPSCGKP